MLLIMSLNCLEAYFDTDGLYHAFLSALSQILFRDQRAERIPQHYYVITLLQYLPVFCIHAQLCQ